MDRLQLKPWEGEAATRPTNDRWCSFFFSFTTGEKEREISTLHFVFVSLIHLVPKPISKPPLEFGNASHFHEIIPY
jgi:hypothetical protein